MIRSSCRPRQHVNKYKGRGEVGGVPADQKVGDGGSLHGAVPAEGEARLAVDVLRISCIRPIVRLVDRDLNLCSFGMGLPKIRDAYLKDTLDNMLKDLSAEFKKY